MPILNYTTKVDHSKTIGEIMNILVKGGANKIVTDYSDNLPTGITFCLTINGSLVAYSLPCNYAGVLQSMRNNKKVTRANCNDEQALRVSWRILKDWVAAQMAIVESRLANIDEVFLPYAITRQGTTLYKYIQGNEGRNLLN